MIESIIFFALAVMTIVPAVLVVSVRNVFHSALWLVACLTGVAGIYAMLAADFLFAVQLLVYIGGVMVVLLFVILLSGKPADWQTPQVNEKAWAAGIFSLFFVVVVGTAVHSTALVPVPSSPKPTTGELGTLLVGPMVLPLEIISLVLVAALVGAIYFSVKRAE